MEKQKPSRKLSPINSPLHLKAKQQKEKGGSDKVIASNQDENQIQNENKNSSQLVKSKGSKFYVDQYDEKAIILCQFCGGETCPQQNYLVNKIQPNAIEGLHSNWITDSILATQRPSDKLIKKFNLIQAFKKYKLNTILNLQEPGQHPYCGDGIDLYNGFSYNPQTFFQNGIRFQNQCWEDMTATTFQHMMKIMNIFHKSINQNKGRIAVHCHAGRGRTLLVICSWLIYNDGMSAQKTIQLATQKRQGVLTRSSQRDFLRQFEKELHLRRKFFHHIQHKSCFQQFCQWQKICLLNQQKKQAKQRSFVHYKTLDALRSRIQKQGQQILRSFLSLSSSQKVWTKNQQEKVASLKKQLQSGKRNIAIDQQPQILVALLQDFYDNLPFTVLSLHSVQLLRNQLKHEEQLSTKQGKRAITKIKNINENILRNDINNEVNQLALESKLVYQNQKQKQNENENEKSCSNSNNQSSGTDGFKKSNKDSNLAWLPLHLKILYQPSIVHELGVSGISTLLDFALFAKQLIKSFKQKLDIKERTSLFIKISIILQSKKQFFPRIFRGDHLRQSKLLQKIDKIQKYTNKNITYIANYIQALQEKLPEDDDFIQKIILKLKKVQSNIQYFKTQHKTQNRFHDIDKLKKIYDDARIQ